MQTVGNRKKNRYFILEIPYFSYAFFQKMLNVSLEHSFNATFREHGELHMDNEIWIKKTYAF